MIFFEKFEKKSNKLFVKKSRLCVQIPRGNLMYRATYGFPAVFESDSNEKMREKNMLLWGHVTRRNYTDFYSGVEIFFGRDESR